MSEFKLVQNAVYSPTVCFTCGTHEGPFIDTNMTPPIFGHVYICAGDENRPGCIRQMARLNGMLDPEASLELAELVVELAEVRAQLTEERKSKNLTPAAIREQIALIREEVPV